MTSSRTSIEHTVTEVSAERAAPSPNVALLRAMLLLRAYDERAVLLQRQGRIGAYPSFWGEEGIQAAAVMALRETDWIFPTYRQNAIPILRGMPAERALGYFNGDPQSLFDPAEFGCAPQCVPIATQIPHAVGWAWGQAVSGADDVALAFFGDGATSEGDFHEGVNFAGVLQAPVVLLCTNNRWAISTPVSHQTAAASLVDKAIGYGIVGEQVDGFDAVAVRDAVADAVARARAGLGPTFIEAIGYRIGPHATPDDPDRYRDPAEAEAWRAHEPVARLARTLIERGELTRLQLEGEIEWAHTVLVEAIERLPAAARVERRRLVEHVLATPPAQLLSQLDGRTA